MHIALFSNFLKLELESMVMDLKIELTRSKNLGLDIKIHPIWVSIAYGITISSFALFDKSYTVLSELHPWAWFLYILTMEMSSSGLKT